MVLSVRDRPEFEEIPDDVKDLLDEEIRREVFDALLAEAVARKELPPPPETWFDKWPGKLLGIVTQLEIGALIGVVSVALVLFLMRQLTTVL